MNDDDQGDPALLLPPTDDDHRCNPNNRYAVSDYQGIFLFYTCGDACEKHKSKRYRPEIFTGYTQADVDEPIEPEEDIPGYTPVDIEPW